MPETTPLIKAALNLRGGAGFDVYGIKKITIDTKYSLMPVFTRFISYTMKMKKDLFGVP